MCACVCVWGGGDPQYFCYFWLREGVCGGGGGGIITE